MVEKTMSPILGLLQDLYSVYEAGGPDIRRDSPADCEIRSFSRPESVKTAFFQGMMAVESAADHLEGLDLLVRGRDFAIAPWTCARGLVEASAIATWLLDTKIGVKERVSRSLALRFTALQEQEKMARTAGDQKMVAQAQERIGGIEKIAAELGYPILRDRKKRRIGVAQPKPILTELITNQFGAQNVYRILSGVAHSNYAFLLRLAFVRENTSRSRGVLVKRAIPIELQKGLATKSTEIFTRGAWFQTIQFGYDAAEVAVILEKRFDELNIKNSNTVRFWRTVVGGGT